MILSKYIDIEKSKQNSVTSEIPYHNPRERHLEKVISSCGAVHFVSRSYDFIVLNNKRFVNREKQNTTTVHKEHYSPILCLVKIRKNCCIYTYQT